MAIWNSAICMRWRSSFRNVPGHTEYGHHFVQACICREIGAKGRSAGRYSHVVVLSRCLRVQCQLSAVLQGHLQQFSTMVEANSLLVPGAIVVSTTAAIAGAVQLYRHLQLSSVTDRSTTSSAGGGAVAYETSKAVDEYVQMHFALADEVFPYKNAPKVRVASLL